MSSTIFTWKKSLIEKNVRHGPSMFELITHRFWLHMTEIKIFLKKTYTYSLQLRYVWALFICQCSYWLNCALISFSKILPYKAKEGRKRYDKKIKIVAIAPGIPLIVRYALHYHAFHWFDRLKTLIENITPFLEDKKKKQKTKNKGLVSQRIFSAWSQQLKQRIRVGAGYRIIIAPLTVFIKVWPQIANRHTLPLSTAHST